jgi:hypothetical protein
MGERVKEFGKALNNSTLSAVNTSLSPVKAFRIPYCVSRNISETFSAVVAPIHHTETDNLNNALS